MQLVSKVNSDKSSNPKHFVSYFTCLSLFSKEINLKHYSLSALAGLSALFIYLFVIIFYIFLWLQLKFVTLKLNGVSTDRQSFLSSSF